MFLQFSCSIVSYSLRPHGLKHARLPCPSPTPGAYSNSCPLSRWCHPSISSSVNPFSCLQSFPASGSFPVSQFFASAGQSIGVSASISVSNEYSGLISFGLVLIPLAVQGTLKVQGPDKSGHQSNMKETAETSRLLGVPCGICAGNREGVLPNLPFSDGKTVLMFGVVKVV